MKALFDIRPCLNAEELEAYTNGRLHKADTFAIENHLLDCALCAAAVEGKQSEKEVDHHKNSQKRIYLAASLILGLLLAAALMYYFWPKTQGEALFYAYYDRPTPSLSRTPQTIAARADGMAYFHIHKFEESYISLSNYLEKSETDSEAALFAGLAALESNQYENAETYLRLASRETPIQESQNAKWFLALAYLKQEKLSKAKSTLEELMADPSPEFRMEAEELLQKISGIKQ